jgi:alpha-beta hydrolase superfamily lysophospholipase
MRAAWLTARGEPFLALLHVPAPDAPRRRTAVLLVGPLGWDDVASYRPRHDWAEVLAAQGHPAARIDLPGTGDSAGGPGDPGRLPAWTAAVEAAVAWLRLAAGLPRVAVVGIGAGGLIAAAAQAEGAGADELVLWGVPARGRTAIRELQAFAQMEAPQLGAPSGAPEGGLAAGGFTQSAETVEALNAIDLRAAPLAGTARALLLGRDGVAPDKALAERLREEGADVTTAAGHGFGAMHGEPHDAQAPGAVIDEVLAWLDAAPATAPEADAAPPAPAHVGEAADLGGARERVLTVPFEGGALFGVVTEPVAQPARATALLLNAGAIRHIGPNRMWVEAARRWAGLGVATVRLDVQGIGDAEGLPARNADTTLYVPVYIAQVRAAVDAAEQAGLPAPFVLGGLCSGAYWALHAALEDDRVTSAVLLNPRLLVWDEELVERRRRRHALRRPRVRGLRKLVRGQIGLAWFRRRARELARELPRILRRRRLRTPATALEECAGRIEAARDTRFVLAFSGEEPLCDELSEDGTLARLEALGHVRRETLPGTDHTLRSVPAQQAAHAVLDAAVAAELG